MKKQKFAKQDYTRSMLPQTRKAIFFDVVQLQWKNLVLLGLILLLLYVPVVLVTMLRDLMQADIYLSMQNSGDAAQLTAQDSIVYLQLFHGILLIPLMALFSVALSGVLRVIRQYAWEENVHMTTDLGRGIRDNYRHTAAITTLGAVIYVLCLMVYHSASAYQNAIFSLFSLLPVGISVLVVLPIFAIALAMVPVYTNSLWATIKNAFYVYCRSLLKVLLALICSLLPWAATFIPNFYCHIFGSLAGALLTPFCLLAWTLFCYNQFDKHINPDVSPQLVGKGIVRNTEGGNNAEGHAR